LCFFGFTRFALVQRLITNQDIDKSFVLG
jgi:hypothetical protein